MRLTVVFSIALCLSVAGCSTKSDVEPEPSAQEIDSKSGWDCQLKQDGLGENFSCGSTKEDAEGIYWTFTLMCTSDLKSRHSITGIDSSRNSIMWPVGEKKFVKVRIDSKPIEEWAVNTKGGGQGLLFVTNEKSSLDADSNEARDTWNFLSEIAGAKTFGFEATDADGYVRSVLFNIENSIPVAAKFALLGCKSS